MTRKEQNKILVIKLKQIMHNIIKRELMLKYQLILVAICLNTNI